MPLAPGTVTVNITNRNRIYCPMFCAPCLARLGRLLSLEPIILRLMEPACAITCTFMISRPRISPCSGRWIALRVISTISATEPVSAFAKSSPPQRALPAEKCHLWNRRGVQEIHRFWSRAQKKSAVSWDGLRNTQALKKFCKPPGNGTSPIQTATLQKNRAASPLTVVTALHWLSSSAEMSGIHQRADSDAGLRLHGRAQRKIAAGRERRHERSAES